MFRVSTLDSQWQQPTQTSTSPNVHCVPIWVTDRTLTWRNCSLMVWDLGLGPVSRGNLDHCDIMYWRRKRGSGSGACFSLWPPGPELKAMCGETQKAWPSASTNCISPASPPLREHPSPSLGWHSVYSHIHLSCPQSAAWIEMLWPWWMVFLITLKNKKESSTKLEVILSFFVCFLFDFLVSLFISSEDAPSVFFFLQ